MENPFLVGSNIYLRPIELNDTEFLCQTHNDPVIREALFMAFPVFLELEQEKIKQYMNLKDSIVLMIVEQNTNVSVGQTALFRIDYVSRAAVFYLTILKPEYWSKGFGAEAVQLMVDYAFSTLNLNRIQLHVCAENIPAIKIYQKVGFVREGILRQAMYRKGAYCDFWVMGLLRQEWLDKKIKVHRLKSED